MFRNVRFRFSLSALLLIVGAIACMMPYLSSIVAAHHRRQKASERRAMLLETLYEFESIMVESELGSHEIDDVLGDDNRSVDEIASDIATSKAFKSVIARTLEQSDDISSVDPGLTFGRQLRLAIARDLLHYEIQENCPHSSK